MTKADRIREAWRAEQESKTEAERQQADRIREAARAQLAAEADSKVRENRLRRMAERQGLKLVKSRRRDPRALDYGTYMLADAQTNYIVAGDHQNGYGETLDDIEEYLTTSRST